MAGDFQGFALEKAELLSSRLKEILTSGQGYVRAQFGVDLGLKPELYPTWVILSTAAVGLLLLLGLSWAVVCGGLFVGKKQGSPVTRSSCEPEKASLAKTAKPEEQKKRNKKKTLEKRTQPNGQPVAVAQEEVKVTEAVSKRDPQIKSEKVNDVQAPVQVKKNKKKTKPDVKPVQHVFTVDGKEPDDGAWETKVSNREKKRRKDKSTEDSGSPGGVEAPKTSVEAPIATAPANTKKNRGNQETLHSRSTGKRDAASGAVSSSWREEPSVNGGGWTDISMKTPEQMAVVEGTKWSAIHMARPYRATHKPQSWAQETQAWSGIDGRRNTDLNPVSFSMLGPNTTDPISNAMELQWPKQTDGQDEWSGFNGMTAEDQSSDWNAPLEHWGNYEEVVVTPAPPPKEQPVPNKVSEDEKDIDDPSSGANKSKRKRRRKKKAEEEATSEAQTVTAAPQELPVPASKKHNPNISSAQKKPEQIVEPPKPTQKKKVRRET
uniref:metadherin a isoform X2 n=1 Tax=Scatophagus argus TaxID=75038 RepID=UPI001ED7D259|nr:metadherin a isoform X2 [Scatophagus argus]